MKKTKSSKSKAKSSSSLLTSKDAAYIVDCCPDDILYLRRRGIIRGFKLGKGNHRFRWGFRLSDVKNLAFIVQERRRVGFYKK